MKSYYNKAYFTKRDTLDEHLASSIDILMHKKKFTKVVDIGCGTGRLVKYLRDQGYDAYGCDIEAQALIFAKKLAGRHVKYGAATKLPYKNNSFEIAISISVIEHLTIKDAEKFIKETSRILKAEGVLFLVTPNWNSPFRFIQGKKWFGYSDPTHKTFYGEGSLGRILKKYGFSNIETRFKTSLDTPFDWDLPDYLRRLPQPAKNLITYLLISSPLTFLRNSIWMSVQKK